MMREAIENINSAIHNGRTDIVRSLIAAAEQSENLPSDDSFSPEEFINNLVCEEGTFLHLATKLNQTDIVRLLLAAGADPGIQNNDGQNATELANTLQMQAVYTEELLKATAQANIGRICQLLAAGLSVNSTDNPKSGNTALHWAATFANKDTVQCLLGIQNIFLVWWYNFVVLKMCCNHFCDILDRDANVNVVNSSGATPLHDAVYKMDLENVEELLERGANPTIKAFKGKFKNKTPLDLASNSPHISLLMQRYLGNFVNGIHSGDFSKNLESNSLESLTSLTHDSSTAGKLSLLSLSKDNPEFFPPGNRSDVTPPKPLITNSKLHQLWPQPQCIIQLEGNAFKIPNLIKVFVIPGPDQSTVYSLFRAWDVYKNVLGANYKFDGLSPSSAEKINFVSLNINANLFQIAESYKINVNCDGVNIIASDLRGFHNAMATYIQLIRLFDDEGAIPQVHIRDWPSIPHRGILLDFSIDGRIPTLDNVIAIADILSGLKINEIYFYNQFSFENSWEVSYSSKDLVTLDCYCVNLGMSLNPAIDVEQNLSRSDFDDFVIPLRNFLKCFCNNRFIFMGPNLSKLLIKNSSPNEFLALLCIPTTITLIICCNSILCDYNVLKTLPDNLLLLDYGFHPSYNFTKSCRKFNQFGCSVGVLLAADSLGSLTCLPETTLCNNYQAARCALEEPVVAYIAADWSSKVFPSPNVHSWPGYVIAAGLSWNTSVQLDYIQSVISDILNLHVFGDKSGRLGRVILGLGHAESFMHKLSLGVEMNELCDLSNSKGTLLLQLLSEPNNANLEFLTTDIFAKMVRILKKHQSDLEEVINSNALTESWRGEVQLTIDLMHFVCRLGKALVMVGQNPNASMGIAVINLGIANLAPTTRTDLANRLLGLIEQFKDVWQKFNLDYNLETTLNRLNSLLEQLIPETLFADVKSN